MIGPGNEGHPPPLPARSRRVGFLWWVSIGMGELIVTIVVYRPLENWRGKRAWNRCQQDLLARGEVIDWENYVPAQVSEAQNIFKAPEMTEWFAGRNTNELIRFLDPQNL